MSQSWHRVDDSTRHNSELAAAMPALFAADGPALLHVHADPELVQLIGPSGHVRRSSISQMWSMTCQVKRRTA